MKLRRTKVCQFLGHPVYLVECSHCVLFSSRVRVRTGVRIRFSVWLVSCYARVFVRLYVVIVTDRMQSRHSKTSLRHLTCGLTLTIELRRQSPQNPQNEFQSGPDPRNRPLWTRLFNHGIGKRHCGAASHRLRERSTPHRGASGRRDSRVDDGRW